MIRRPVRFIHNDREILARRFETFQRLQKGSAYPAQSRYCEFARRHSARHTLVRQHRAVCQQILEST